MKIPLLMVLELLKHHDDDRMEHQLRVGVVGVKEPITAEIESDFFANPRVTDISGHGLDVPGQLENDFVLKCFGLLWPDPWGCGTEVRELFLHDASSWIKAQFLTADAEVLETELRRQVTPDLVKGGNRYTSMVPVRLAAEGGRS